MHVFSRSISVPVSLFFSSEQILDQENGESGMKEISRAGEWQGEGRQVEKQAGVSGQAFWQAGILAGGHSGRRAFWQAGILAGGHSGRRAFWQAAFWQAGIKLNLTCRLPGNAQLVLIRRQHGWHGKLKEDAKP